MKIRRFFPSEIPFSGRLILIPIILLLFIWLFQIFYNELKQKSIEDYNHELTVFARTASSGIAYAFDDYKSDLTFLSNINHIISNDDSASALMKDYYENNSDQIAAISRMDKNGQLIFTWPENESATGSSISHQFHVQKIMEEHRPVISDVFMAEQGYLAIAIHVPVFNQNKFNGSIAALIPIDYLGAKYLENLTFRSNEKTWLLSENNIEIYCPIEGHTGKSFLENAKNDPSAKLLLEKIRGAKNGTGESFHLEVFQNKTSTPEEKQIVFYRIPLGNTYWTILISLDHDDVHAEIIWFRNHLIIGFFLLFVVLAYYLYSLTKVRTLLKEEAKRRKAEKNLSESEARYRTLAESSPMIILTHTMDGEITYVNQSGAKIIGHSADELTKKNIFDLLTKEQKPEFKSALLNLLEKKYNIHRGEMQFTVGGNNQYLEVTGTLINSDSSDSEILMQAMDITDRKNAELKIKDSEHRLKEAEKIGKLGHVDWNVAEQRSYWSDEIFEIYERNPELGVPGYDEIMALHVPEDAKKLEAAVIKALNEGVDYDLDLVAKTAAGNKKYLHIIGKPIKDKYGKVTNIKGTVQDITERKIAEKKLRQREEKYRALFQNAPIMHGIVNTKGNYEDVNEAVYKMLGYTREELKGKNAFNFIHPDDLDSVNFAFAKTTKSGEGEVIYRFRHKNGQYRLMSSKASEIPGTDSYFVHSEDITERKKAENNLRESESKFRTIFDQSPIGIELYNSEGMQLDANKASLEMFGIPDLAEVKNFNLFDGTSLDEAKKAKLRDGQAVTYQAVFDFDKVKKLGQYKTSKSGTADFDFIVNPLIAEQGKNIGYLVMVQDITEKKRFERDLIQAREKAEESELKVRSMFENTLTGILFCTPEGKILEANPAILKIVGSPSLEESLKLNLLNHEPLQKIGFSQNIVKCLKEKKLINDEVNYTSKYGKSTYLKYFLIPIIINDNIIGVWANVNDLTDLWQTQQDLKMAKERAEESDRLKSAFLANMSHEIRTPMNGILGFADLLKEPVFSPEEKNNFISIIEKSGQRMLNIINDLIDISKIESGQMKVVLGETNIAEQAEYLSTFFKPEANKKGLELICKFPDKDNQETVLTDREKVYAVLTNLLKNAIKYTRKGSIEFGYRNLEDEQGENHIRFFVKDTGIGIPNDRLGAIFDRFVQADIEDRQAMEGAGLGLAISKAYAEMLGGNITVESEAGKGSTFYFTFRANPKEPATEKDPETIFEDNQDNIKKLKVLIAEDDENSLLHLSIILKNMTGEMLVAKTGNDAVEMIRKNPDADLALMDIKMPGMDGYAATREIRKFNKDIIIIAQTAYALAGDREKAIEAGCNEYIAKPIKKKELLDIISAYLGMYQGK